MTADKSYGKTLNQAQLHATSLYFIESSKAIILFMLVGILFPQTAIRINFLNGIIGFIIPIIFFVIGILVLKEVKNHVR